MQHSEAGWAIHIHPEYEALVDKGGQDVDHVFSKLRCRSAHILDLL
jgi:hypothetical protein